MFQNMPQAPQEELSAERVQGVLALFERTDVATFELQLALANAWGAGFVKPSQQLQQDRWIELFRRVGFFSLTGAPAPAEPIRLYRGAMDGWERGMSWTTSPALARRFDVALWTCLAPPSAVLAVFAMHHYAPSGEDFGEYVLDTDGLDIEESAAGTGGMTLQFRGRTIEAVERHVRSFLADAGLGDLRSSALGWEVVHPRRKHDLAAVRFFGPDVVIFEVARRHARWHY